MSAEQILERLRGRHPHGCLSLYTAAGPGLDASYYRALLKDVERQLAADLDTGHARRLEVEMLQVGHFIDDVRPPGMPLAIFSCAEDDVLEALRLPEDVDTAGFLDTQFHVAPLVAQVERHPSELARLP